MGGENLAICKTTWRRGFIFVILYHFVICSPHHHEHHHHSQSFGAVGTCWGGYMVLRLSSYGEFKAGTMSLMMTLTSLTILVMMATE